MIKNVKVIIVDENDVYIGEGHIHGNDETQLLGDMFHSKTVEKCIDSANLWADVKFNKYTRKSFVIENHEYADENTEMFKPIDLSGVVAIRVFSKVGFMLNVDEYRLGDEHDYDENDCDVFINYPKTFNENYTAKIEDGIAYEGNVPMMFY